MRGGAHRERPFGIDRGVKERTTIEVLQRTLPRARVKQFSGRTYGLRGLVSFLARLVSSDGLQDSLLALGV